MTSPYIPKALEDVANVLNNATTRAAGEPGGDGVALQSVSNPAWYDLPWREIESLVRHMCQLSAENGPVTAKTQIDALMPKLRRWVEEYPQ